MGYVVLRKENVNVFRLPQVNVSKGHYLDSWKDKIWRGNVHIKTDEEFLTVELVSYDGSLYAKAKIPTNYSTSVEKCKDSSRGYALKITNDNDNRFAWVGLVFHDRNAAFDFFVTFDEQLRRKNKVYEPIKIDPNLNFKLQKGKKIKLNLNLGGNETNQQPKAQKDPREELKK